MEASPPVRPTVVIVSMPNVVMHNQLVYVRLAELGWNVKYVVPGRWRDDYTPGGFVSEPLDAGEEDFARVPIAFPGSIQRHFYLTRPASWLRRWKADIVFVELEPFSLPTIQWGIAAQRLGIPWGCQGDENLDRKYPLPAVAFRRWSMPRIDFFAARSPGGQAMLEQWGARGPIRIVPHTIPEWESVPRPRSSADQFTVGFAGRLVSSKGIADLVAAARRLPFAFTLLVAGDGPMRRELEQADLGLGRLDLRTGLRTSDMPAIYSQMDVLVLPSRTTATWAEQFGKVLCEALLCGTPVVGSDSGEIPWVVRTSGGGRVFAEGNVSELASVLIELRADTEARSRFGERGRRGVLQHFSPRVATRELDELLRGALKP